MFYHSLAMSTLFTFFPTRTQIYSARYDREERKLFSHIALDHLHITKLLHKASLRVNRTSLLYILVISLVFTYPFFWYCSICCFNMFFISFIVSYNFVVTLLLRAIFEVFQTILEEDIPFREKPKRMALTLNRRIFSRIRVACSTSVFSI